MDAKSVALPEVLVPITGIAANRGGRTKAIIERANLLASFYNVRICCLLAQFSWRKELQKLQQAGRMQPYVRVDNAMEQLACFVAGASESDVARLITTRAARESSGELLETAFARARSDHSKLVRTSVSEAGLTRHGFRDDVKDGFLTYECLASEDAGDFLALVKHRSEHSKFVSPQDRAEIRVGGRYFTWDNLHFFYAFCLDLILKQVHRAIVFSDVIDIDPIVAALEQGVLARIAVIHGASLKRMKAAYQGAFDGWVVTTKEQLRDARKIQVRAPVTVIPHGVWSDLESPSLESENSTSVVYVGHLEPLKRVDHAIRAFALAREQVPLARLKIYGRGSSLEQLQALSRELGVADSVEFMGYTTTPRSAFRAASVSVFPSRSEGFGYVVAESILSGTPVAAYDIRYGPRSLISQGDTGWLIPDGDIAGLAKAIVEGLQSPRARRAESARLELAQALSPLTVQKRWVDFLRDIWSSAEEQPSGSERN